MQNSVNEPRDLELSVVTYVQTDDRHDDTYIVNVCSWHFITTVRDISLIFLPSLKCTFSPSEGHFS